MNRLHNGLGACVLLALMGATWSCVDPGTEPAALTGPDGLPSLQLAFTPHYASAVNGEPSPISRIRLTATGPGGSPVLVQLVTEVDPEAEGWEMGLEVPVQRDVPAVYVLVELLSVTAAEERVEWSGQAGPFTRSSAQDGNASQVSLYRGPPGNLSVESVAISGGPLDLREGESGSLVASVEGGDDVVVYWGTLDPEVAEVAADGSVTGILPGETRIVAEAGPRSDTATVRVRPRVDGIRVDVERLEADALGDEVAPEAVAVDPRGDPIPDETLLWELSSSGILEPTAPGVFRTVGVGEGEVIIRVDGVSGIEARVPFRVFQTPVGLELVPGALIFTYLGEEAQAEAAVWDRNGHAIPDAQVTWEISDPAVVALVEPGMLRAVADGEATVTAQVEGLSATLETKVERVPAGLSLDPPEATLDHLGAQLQLSAVVVDAGGSAMDGTPVEWSVEDPGVLLLEATGMTAMAQAVSAGRSGVTARSGEVSETAEVVVSQRPVGMALMATPEPRGEVGTPVQPTPRIQVTDAGGSSIPGVSVALRVTAGGGQVRPSTLVTDGAGQAGPEEWVLGGVPGVNALEMAVDGLEPVRAVVEAVSGPPATLEIVRGQNQTARIGGAVPVPPVVLVTDGLGNPLVGVEVLFSLRTEGGAVTPNRVLTDAAGQAGVGSWILASTPGANTLVAEVSGLPAVEFTAQGEVGAPHTLEQVGGTGQEEIVGAPLPEALVVRVLDDQGVPVPGREVAFTVTAGGGSVEVEAAATDADGVASAGVWTLGPTGGTQSVMASAGSGVTTTFAATAHADFWVVGGEGGGGGDPTLLTSPNGVDFTPRAHPVDQSIHGLATNGSQMVAAGEGSSTLAVSSNGVAWSGAANSLSTAARAVAWGNPQWVAVGTGGSGIVTSPDGQNWTAGTPPGAFQGYGVAYGGGRWVVVGDGDSPLLTSTDVSVWTAGAASGLAIGRAVGWNGNQWVVGGSGTQPLWVSRNGTDWNPVSGPLTEVHGVAWNGAFWLATGTDANGVRAAVSEDGLTWDARTTPLAGVGSGVAWNGELWLAVREAVGGGSTLITSPDGVSWSPAEPPLPHSYRAVMWSGVSLYPFPWNQAPAVTITSHGASITMEAGDPVQVEAEATDPEDGVLAGGSVSWESSMDGELGTGAAVSLAGLSVGSHVVVVTATDAQGAVARTSVEVEVEAAPTGPGDVQWLALGGDLNEGRDGPYVSYDGVGWSGTETFTWTEYWQRLVFGAGRWVAVGVFSTSVWVSDDGLAWTEVETGAPGYLNDVTWNGALFLAVGRDGTILTSPDGVVWTQRASGTTEDLWGAAWNGSFWFAWGSFNTPNLISEDGINWEVLPGEQGVQGEHGMWNGWTWLITGNGTTGVKVSTDALTWTEYSLGGDNPSGVAWTGTQWVVTTWDGTIWTSTDAFGTSWNREYAGTDETFWYSSVASDGSQTFAVGYRDLGSEFAPVFLERVGGTWEPRDAGLWGWFLPVAARTPAPTDAGPVARITAPAHGSTVELDASVTFQGEGVHPVEGALSGGQLTWSSDRQGILGTGTSVTRSDLLFGVHTLTLTAEDSQGRAHSRTIQITVDGPTEWVALARDPSFVRRIYTSPDGVNWLARDTPVEPSASARIWWTGTEWIVGAPGTSGHFLFRSTDGRTWTSVATSGLYASVSDLAWNGGQWVLVSSGEREIFTSSDFTSWVLRRDGGSSRSLQPAWNGQGWLMAGSGVGDLVRSPDGSEWETFSSGAEDPHYRTGWTGSRWVVAGSGTSPYYSSADGAGWTTMTNSPAMFARDLLCETGLCIVVGDFGGIHYTADGLAWNLVTSPTSGHLQALGYDGSTWLAGTSAGEMIQSSDGMTWSGVTLEYADFGLVYRISGRHLSLANQAPNVSITSPAHRSTFADAASIGFQGSATDPEDGLLTPQWESNRDGLLGSGASLSSTLSSGIHNITLRAQDGDGAASTDRITVRSGLDSWIVVGTYNTDLAWSAAAATPGDWTIYSSGFTTTPVNNRLPHAIGYGGGWYVGVTPQGEIFRSPGGLVWESMGQPTTNSLLDVAWNGNHWVAVGNSGTIVRSPDGATWTVVQSSGSTLWAVEWNGSEWIAVGGSSTVLRSTDGITWTAAASPPAGSPTLLSLGWNGSEWLAGGNGRVYVSSDGDTWMENDIPGFTNAIVDLAWSGSAWALAESDDIWTSPDGVNWTQRHSTGGETIRFLSYGGGWWVAGTRWSLHSSSDGSVWSSFESPVEANFASAVFRE